MAKQVSSGSAPRPRNKLATHPLLKKGGLHGKTRKAERKNAKQGLRREWPAVTLAAGGVTTAHSAGGYACIVPVVILSPNRSTRTPT